MHSSLELPENFLSSTPLLYNFGNASRTKSADLTKIFEDPLVGTHPVNAVTLIQKTKIHTGARLWKSPLKTF